jgi:hypothetical protein
MAICHYRHRSLIAMEKVPLWAGPFVNLTNPDGRLLVRREGVELYLDEVV